MFDSLVQICTRRGENESGTYLSISIIQSMRERRRMGERRKRIGVEERDDEERCDVPRWTYACMDIDADDTGSQCI